MEHGVHKVKHVCARPRGQILRSSAAQISAPPSTATLSSFSLLRMPRPLRQIPGPMRRATAPSELGGWRVNSAACCPPPTSLTLIGSATRVRLTSTRAGAPCNSCWKTWRATWLLATPTGSRSWAQTTQRGHLTRSAAPHKPMQGWRVAIAVPPM